MRFHALRRTVRAVVPARERRRTPGVAETLAEIAVAFALSVGVGVAAVLSLALLTVCAPFAAFVAAWLAWRSDRAAAGVLPVLRARWGRSARVIAGGLDQRP